MKTLQSENVSELFRLCRTKNVSKYAALQPKANELIIKTFEKSKQEKTKVSYVSAINNWIRWNLELDLNPFYFDKEKVKFWIASRIDLSPSIKGLATWIASISWLASCVSVVLDWKKDHDFIAFKSNLKKQWGEDSDDRLPFKIHHIQHRLKVLGVSPETFMKCPFNNLLEALIICLLFFTMSRPAELFTDSDVGVKGLRIGHLKSYVLKEPHFVQIKIGNYKNQKQRKKPKLIYLKSTWCEHHDQCICHALNPYKLLKFYVLRRQKLCEKQGCHQSLAMKPANHVFVRNDGEIVKKAEIAKIAKDLVFDVNLSDIDRLRYKGYSFRIGGSSQATKSGISLAKIMKYVQWSDSALPSAAFRYMRYDTLELAAVPFEMLHGVKQNDGSLDCVDFWHRA